MRNATARRRPQHQKRKRRIQIAALRQGISVPTCCRLWSNALSYSVLLQSPTRILHGQCICSSLLRFFWVSFCTLIVPHDVWPCRFVPVLLSQREEGEYAIGEARTARDTASTMDLHEYFKIVEDHCIWRAYISDNVLNWNKTSLPRSHSRVSTSSNIHFKLCQTL